MGPAAVLLIAKRPPGSATRASRAKGIARALLGIGGCLISAAAGVGTKLKVAFLTGRHDTVGSCLVSHCVNDIAVQGASPLFFLDYFAVGKLSADVASQVVTGLARACAKAARAAATTPRAAGPAGTSRRRCTLCFT